MALRDDVAKAIYESCDAYGVDDLWTEWEQADRGTVGEFYANADAAIAALRQAGWAPAPHDALDLS